MTGDDETGRMAASPRQISWRGWGAIARRVWREKTTDHVSLIAAGVAFYGLLALFPAITALMALAGVILEPGQVAAQIDTLSNLLPESAADIIVSQAESAAEGHNGALGFAALLGLGFAIWSASKGVGSLIEGINVAYDETEDRGTIRLTLTRLALTLVLVVGVVAGLTATIALPSLLQLFSLGQLAELLIGLVRWVALIVLTVLGLAVLYRYAPSRNPAQWRWLTPGAVLATLMWLCASAGFAAYVKHFGSYHETFGTLAGVIILLMWLWISAFLILIGAELNAESEAQTRLDTTTGKPMPMGSRNATKADTLAG